MTSAVSKRNRNTIGKNFFCLPAQKTCIDCRIFTRFLELFKDRMQTTYRLSSALRGPVSRASQINRSLKPRLRVRVQATSMSRDARNVTPLTEIRGTYAQTAGAKTRDNEGD